MVPVEGEEMEMDRIACPATYLEWIRIGKSKQQANYRNYIAQDNSPKVAIRICRTERLIQDDD